MNSLKITHFTELLHFQNVMASKKNGLLCSTSSKLKCQKLKNISNDTQLKIVSFILRHPVQYTTITHRTDDVSPPSTSSYLAYLAYEISYKQWKKRGFSQFKRELLPLILPINFSLMLMQHPIPSNFFFKFQVYVAQEIADLYIFSLFLIDFGVSSQAFSCCAGRLSTSLTR